ncbi:MAG: DNA cytosine methyltransferase [Peptidiphaga gingivicola]
MGKVVPIDNAKPGVLEFFAGIGLARIGLEAAGFRVTWANDFDPDKKAMYEAQFEDAGDHVFALGDIGKITADELPRDAALAWASSPCTDLSLAGGRAGLAGNQSGTFWHFVRLLEELEDGRPQIAVLENVTGLATSHGGDDLIAAIKAFNRLGYSVDALAIDARRFLPQSRPRLFLVGAQNPPADSPERDFELRPDWLQWIYDDSSLQTHRAPLPLPPAPRIDGLHRSIEILPTDDHRWWSDRRSESFVASLSPVQRERLDILKSEKGTKYRTAYRRTRRGIPVWEMRPA